MTAPVILASNVLAAAFPHRRRTQVSIERAGDAERWRAHKAALLAENARGLFRAVLVHEPRKGDPVRMTWRGRSQKPYAFTLVSTADRDALLAGPVVLLAKRWGLGGFPKIVGIETFEPENRGRLNAWLDRAAVVSGIELHAYRLTGSRAERAAIVADLAPGAPRPSRFVSGDMFDRSAIMRAAIATARLSRERTGAAWRACLSAALIEVWQAAKAARGACARASPA